ncbi:MAG: STAS domain-containing protein [Acidimicrobiia bacterium]
MGETTVNDFRTGSSRDGAMDVLHVSGEVDVSTAPIVKAHMDQLIDKGAMSVVIDLSDLTFIDTSGLSVLARAASRMHGRGRRMVLRSPSQSVRRSLEITGLGIILPIE